jgi:uncharacterized membrane protein
LSTENGVEAVEGSAESLEPVLDVILHYVTLGIEVAAAIIIAISVVIAFIGFFRTVSRRQKGEEVVRFRLAGGLLLALDLVVGSDIILTILDPSAEDLIRLSVIVAIRIILGWSLSKEISGHSEDLLRK